MKYNKKRLFDGFHTNELFQRYNKVVKKLTNKYPVLTSARFAILFSLKESSFKDLNISLLRIIRIIRSLNNKKYKKTLSIKPCDILLFYSSNKPSFQPAISKLAQRLARKGFRCAIMSPKDLHVVSCMAKRKLIKKEIQNFSAFLGSYKNKLKIINILFQTLKSYLVFMHILMKKDMKLFFKIYKDPFNIFCLLFTGVVRQDKMDWILTKIDPKIIITNGDHLPYASELVLSKLKNAYTINFFNEHATGGILPIVSDEVWVWNNTVLKELKKNLPEDNMTTFSIIGKAEIDFTIMRSNQRKSSEKLLLNKAKSKKVLIILSEYVDVGIKKKEQITEEMFSWLRIVAEKKPNWFFIFKSRPFGNPLKIPGFEKVKQLKNFALSDPKVDFKNMLHWKNTYAVCALSSTGLYVAAGFGKPALRLSVSKLSSTLPVIDEVTKAVHSPGELVKILTTLENNNNKILKSARNISNNNKYFPYKGQVLDRMEKLSILHIKQ